MLEMREDMIENNYVMIDRSLLKRICEENISLKKRVKKLEGEKREEPMQGQISLEEYLSNEIEERILKLKNGNQMCNKKNKGKNQGK